MGDCSCDEAGGRWTAPLKTNAIYQNLVRLTYFSSRLRTTILIFISKRAKIHDTVIFIWSPGGFLLRYGAVLRFCLGNRGHVTDDDRSPADRKSGALKIVDHLSEANLAFMMMQEPVSVIGYPGIGTTNEAGYAAARDRCRSSLRRRIFSSKPGWGTVGSPSLYIALYYSPL
ncbi:hypothetical protein GWI33_001753 [Rhynchophorus ferrugineus]|uniref:Uncharacterized protein n=1 Tax=Rhynchophorus ferrugineus TaxID=354439 RepID=A0A834MGS6_RHYFE|nr:hypothetical protein GWI33_001753 [Rhynchophorus ferrugineus]